jgi:hypothetical protein
MSLTFCIVGIALGFALIIAGLFAAFIGVGMLLAWAERKENGR